MIGPITSALLEARADSLFRKALDKWGAYAVYGALDWVTAHQGILPEFCRTALTFHLQSVMDWVEAGPDRPTDSLIAVAHIVAPYSYDISRRNTTIWLRTFHHIQERPNDDATYLAMLLFALALGNAPPEPMSLISASFERIHEAARRDLLDDEVWIIAEPIVPHLSWNNDWDKCERLRRGLAAAFVRHNWPPAELTRCVSNKRLLDDILKSAKRVQGGKEYFWQFR